MCGYRVDISSSPQSIPNCQLVLYQQIGEKEGVCWKGHRLWKIILIS